MSEYDGIFPSASTLKECIHRAEKRQWDELNNRKGPERARKIAEMMSRAAVNGKNYINIRRGWLTDGMANELTKNGMVIEERRRSSDRLAGDSDWGTNYTRIYFA